MSKFPFYKQHDAKDCGPTCLRMIAKYYGKDISIQYIRQISETTREGSSLLGLSEAAENLGFESFGTITNFSSLSKEAPFPCIVHWMKAHFVIVHEIKGNTVYVSDPAYGLISYSKEEFIKHWINENSDEDTEEGVALMLEPTQNFFQNKFEHEQSKASFSFLFKYLLKYKRLVVQLLFGLFIGSLLTLVFPFLTQSIVDVGIKNQDLNIIYLILLAQIMLFAGKMGFDVIRSWVMLHLSTRINISIVSDFFIKLMKLPISFFDTRMTGDILQRIDDHRRIEQLLTNTSLNVLFSLVNLVVFSIVLLFYDYRLFLVYLFGAALYMIWVLFFVGKRRQLDYEKFSKTAQERSKVIELINGMQDIKMYNAEKYKRYSWESIQVELFKLKIKSLSLEQWQSVGGNFINQIKDVLITFLSAKLVLSGDLTLGMMLSVQYIMGQLNTPLYQFIDFIKQSQDAKISLERLSEIHDKDDEESHQDKSSINIPNEDIQINGLSFRYIGTDNYVFENLNLRIPYQKTTAIVGASGSGKTTLLKLLMKFYEPENGGITIGSTDLINISPKKWRENCGVVMQEGYIFNESIAENITIGDENIDEFKLKKAVEIANIREFIEDLPLKYNTKIGNEGLGISGGQKQRIFIARAVYKSPKYIFFDEATSALDASNEKIIMENLEQFFNGKTAIVIAHRLSTVKNADKIIVMDKGKLVEEGNHAELVALKGEYYRLVKNQLELGN
ncbi:peptidase domain-containing ABC transporter [Chryseobacterium pennae]|uniref:Peptidase domain-containing ABC transporter n=1 Tax=Chryseobacterium pennae TaxID=2258962 RepID=A0A3D9CAR2_9FLAO|nr:peptidase domain-containing ABC transporter [Chryseobacterium pennae]REC62960.1 peptidase domain-containing ABC transporter [Chryseobacterium pennae]